MKKIKLWPDMLKPVVVLTVICLCTSLLLAVTNGLTAPLIEEQKRIAANASRTELLKNAEDFIPVDCQEEGITDYYRATNGVGVVISANGKGGYGGDVPVMVAFDENGNILAVKVDASGETKGKGDKVAEPAYTGQFTGRGAQRLKLGEDVQAVAGSTVTSSAALNGVNRAIDAYNKIEKGLVQEEIVLTPEDMCALAYPQGGVLTKLDTAVLSKAADNDTVTDAVYTAEAGGAVIITTGTGYTGEPITVYTAFHADGVIAGVYIDASQQTEGLGTRVGEEDFMGQFAGKTPPVTLGDGIDGVANATMSSQGAVNGVNLAAQCFTENFAEGGEG